MSGIAGVISFDGRAIERGLVESMTEAMAHRGPDGIRSWSGTSATLGHCMLRTTPESIEETQPLPNDDNTVILVMDGRLDNCEELRAELTTRGARMRNRSDAELMLRAYESWGDACLDYCDGDFALVIWDSRRRAAFCARDRLGHKPLHYHWDGRRLAFASELHALLALPWIEEALNEGMIAELLADELRSLDETLWKGIFRIPPAHRATFGADGRRIERYWAPDLGSELRYRREEEYVEHYRALLEEAVRRHSRAIGPLAFEVSGGLDSSAVFAVAQNLHRRGELRASTIDAYTLRFDGGAAGRDLGYARAVGAHLDSQIHEIEPTLKPLEWYRTWARRYRDLPSPPNGTMQLAIARAARERGSHAILGGVGGDQWLTGDHTYFAGSLAAARFGDFIACLRRDARTYGIRRSLFLAVRHGALPLLPLTLRRRAGYIHARLRGKGDLGADCLAEPLAETLAERRYRHPAFEPDLRGPTHRRRLGYLLGADTAAAHEVMERLTSSQGLERRSPLDTTSIVEFGFSVPQHLLLRDGWNRYIHRQALADILPDLVAWRRDKAEFSVTVDVLRSNLIAMTSDLGSDVEAWVSRQGIQRLCAAADQSGPGILLMLWTLNVLHAVDTSRKDLQKFSSLVNST
jgi:asparagine synthase (glutamine-hydrolysing)